MRAVALLVVGVLALTGCTGQPRPQPTLRVEVVADQLEHPWDIGFLPDGSALVTQRPGRLVLLSHGVRPVRVDLTDVYAEGEGGLMGLVIHPDFAHNRRFITCQTHQVNGQPVDIRVVAWQLSPDGASAWPAGPPLVTGMPLNPSGRHSGCRPAVGEDGSLLVGTGDTARASVAQDRSKLGGKVLRMDINTGAPLPGNPFLASRNPAERLIYTYGHRNVQGVAPRPGGQVLVSEHGPIAHDEINLLRAGGNYGWDPSKGGTDSSYDENVPMTDLRRFPDAVSPLWNSGSTTEAPSGATFLTGPQWGRLDGVLAVVALRGSKLLLFTLAPDGGVRGVEVPAELNDTYGRLRGARQGPDGALYVTTSNGTNDKVLRVTSLSPR